MLRVREVFNRLKVANLKLHMKKCSLFQHRVHFLGHVLTEAGTEVQPEKVAAVQNWPTPRNLTELRSFVGLLFILPTVHLWICHHGRPASRTDTEECPFQMGSRARRGFQPTEGTTDYSSDSGHASG